MKFYCVILVLSLVIVTKNEIQAQGLCDICSCEPENAPKTVNCKCDSQNTAFEFSNKKLTTTFKQTTNFMISDCTDSVVFNRNAFRDLVQLEMLEIKDVKKVTFESGVFQHLNHLVLRNIEDLDLKPSAFNGGELKSVEVHNSVIENLPKFSFYNIHALEKFVLDGVNISSIEKNAIMLKDNMEVGIINTTLEKVATNAITIEADSLVLFQSTLRELQDGAVNLTAKTQLVISQSEFDELPSSPLHATAPVVNISKNYFEYLKKDILRNIKGDSDGSIIFINNTIEKFDSDKPLRQPPNTWNIQGNEFECSCKFLQLFVNLKDSPLVQNNFCKSVCLLPLGKALEICSASSSTVLDDEVLCKGYTTLKPIPTHRTRGGRMHDITTEMPKSATHKHNANGTNRIVFATEILLWTLLSIKMLM